MLASASVPSSGVVMHSGSVIYADKTVADQVSKKSSEAQPDEVSVAVLDAYVFCVET